MHKITKITLVLGALLALTSIVGMFIAGNSLNMASPDSEDWSGTLLWEGDTPSTFVDDFKWSAIYNVWVEIGSEEDIEIEVYNYEDGTQENQTFLIQIDQRIEWYENNTGNPQALTFDTTPGNLWPLPSHFFLNSTIENPSIIDPDGREVTVSWNIENHEGICQANNGEIENGESLEWRTIHFAPEGNHEIRLTIEDGQDRINVQHIVEIIYE